MGGLLFYKRKPSKNPVTYETEREQSESDPSVTVSERRRDPVHLCLLVVTLVNVMSGKTFRFRRCGRGFEKFLIAGDNGLDKERPTSWSGRRPSSPPSHLRAHPWSRREAGREVFWGVPILLVRRRKCIPPPEQLARTTRQARPSGGLVAISTPTLCGQTPCVRS